jgi:hypothetical protein
MLGFAAKGILHSVPPPLQFDAGDVLVGAFVHYVIHFAAKRVQGGYRFALFFGQEQKAVIKTRTAAGCFLLTIFFWSHSLEDNQSYGFNCGKALIIQLLAHT